MDFSSIGAITFTALLIGYIGYERAIQLASAKELYTMYNREQIEQAFKSIYTEEYGDKSQDEFQLGLALVALLDMLDNPEEYSDGAMAFVLDNAEEWSMYVRMKYDEEIKALNDEDMDDSPNGK